MVSSDLKIAQVDATGFVRANVPGAVKLIGRVGRAIGEWLAKFFGPSVNQWAGYWYTPLCGALNLIVDCTDGVNYLDGGGTVGKGTVTDFGVYALSGSNGPGFFFEHRGLWSSAPPSRCDQAFCGVSG